MTDLDDRIRDVLRSQAAAMRVPDTDSRHGHIPLVEQPPRRRARAVWLPAAALIAVAIGGAVLLRHVEADPVAPAHTVAAPDTRTGFDFATPTVHLVADSIEVVDGDRISSPTGDVDVVGDPGVFGEYTTLELTWWDDGVQQRINLYFAGDGTEWWVSEIRTYAGGTDWYQPFAVGEYFRSSLGTPFEGALDLPNLTMRGLELEAFVPPTACDEPVAATALVALHPTLEGPAGASGVSLSFELYDTATCRPMEARDLMLVVKIENGDVATADTTAVGGGTPSTRMKASLTLVAPGSTVLHATVTDLDGNDLGAVDVPIGVRAPTATDLPTSIGVTPPDTTGASTPVSPGG